MTILDSDILTLLYYKHPAVQRRYEAVPVDETLAVTVITHDEVHGGRVASLLKSADEAELRTATERLQQLEALLAHFKHLHVDERAVGHFAKLRVGKKTKKMGRADMLIACIALAHDALLATRNTKDFKDVPGLRVENWAD